MRILHISSARTLGGGERHLADLANALARRGHEVFAALPARSPLREELHQLPPENIFTVSLRNALAVRGALELARHVRERGIEIVHAHMARDYPPAALAVARARGGTKLVITRHVLFPLGRLHAVTLSRVSRVIAVSRAVASSLLERKLFPARKIVVIQNGVDFRRLDEGLRRSGRDELRSRLGISAESLLVAAAGDLKRQKGHEEFLRSAALVARERPDARFVIVGADATRSGEYLSSLESLIGELGLEGRVHMAGWLPGLAPLLAAADVYVSASRTESFGLATVEAMASGLAVVATSTEGSSEIIEDGDTGLLVEVGDERAMASAVLRLLGDARERKRLGKLARASVRERFSVDRMVDETEKVYSELRGSE